MDDKEPSVRDAAEQNHEMRRAEVEKRFAEQDRIRAQKVKEQQARQLKNRR